MSADELDPDLSNNTDSVVTATAVPAAAPALSRIGLLMLVGLLTISGLLRLRIASH